VEGIKAEGVRRREAITARLSSSRLIQGERRGQGKLGKKDHHRKRRPGLSRTGFRQGVGGGGGGGGGGGKGSVGTLFSCSLVGLGRRCDPNALGFIGFLVWGLFVGGLLV